MEAVGAREVGLAPEIINSTPGSVVGNDPSQGPTTVKTRVALSGPWRFGMS